MTNDLFAFLVSCHQFLQKLSAFLVGAFQVAGVAGSPGVGIIDGLRLIGEGPVPGAAAALDTPLLRLYAQLALGPPQRLFSEARGTRFLLDLQKAARAVPQHLLEKGPG